MASSERANHDMEGDKESSFTAYSADLMKSSNGFSIENGPPTSGTSWTRKGSMDVTKNAHWLTRINEPL